MIVKKVGRKHKRATNVAVRAHAAKLGKYIVNARAEDRQALGQFEDDRYAHDLGHYTTGQEKVLATRAKNFRSDHIAEQLAELDELIAGVGSDEDIVEHWVLSWHGSDNPTVAEMFDAFDILERCLQHEPRPSITAIHGNTDNPHGHVAVLRIDPLTGKTIAKPHNGWDIEAAHRALALIADRYPNWKVTPHRSYAVINGRMIHRTTKADVGDASNPGSWVPLMHIGSPSTITSIKKLLAKIDHHSLTYEEDTGFKSRKRVAIEEAVPVLLAANSWFDAHSELAKLGIGLELAKNKSGANILIDGKNVKASISDRTSLAKLEKRWGLFQPRPDRVLIAASSDRLMFPADAERVRYYEAKRSYTSQIAQVITDVRSAEEGYKSSVPSATCDPSKIMRLSFPTFSDWLAGGEIPEPTSALAASSTVKGFEVAGALSTKPSFIEGYEARLTARGVGYYKNGDLYSCPALFDVGRRIYVNDETDASIRTALLMMAERSRGRPLKPFGPAEFIARVERIAKAEKIAIDTPVPRAVGKSDASQPVKLREPFEIVGEKSGSADPEESRKQVNLEERAQVKGERHVAVDKIVAPIPSPRADAQDPSQADVNVRSSQQSSAPTDEQPAQIGQGSAKIGADRNLANIQAQSDPSTDAERVAKGDAEQTPTRSPEIEVSDTPSPLAEVVDGDATQDQETKRRDRKARSDAELAELMRPRILGEPGGYRIVDKPIPQPKDTALAFEKEKVRLVNPIVETAKAAAAAARQK